MASETEIKANRDLPFAVHLLKIVFAVAKDETIAGIKKYPFATGLNVLLQAAIVAMEAQAVIKTGTMQVIPELLPLNAFMFSFIGVPVGVLGEAAIRIAKVFRLNEKRWKQGLLSEDPTISELLGGPIVNK